MPPIPGVFDLPAHLAAKADPDLIGSDQQHFTRLGLSLRSSIDELSERLAAERRAHAGEGQAALDRDLEVHRLSARLRTLRRYGLDLCLGRMVPDDGGEPIYVGRIGLTDGNGGRLLVDWRSPAAEPFYGATHGNPMGLRSRRRYRWARGRIADYWDEVFGLEGIESTASLDDQSAFLATLGGSRSTRMRDVLGTLQADQDAVIRTGSRGALVVDGGPGTGKTVVALHRAAYLLYSDPRLARGGGILFVGPHEPYLAYVADVLPSLGEETVRTCTLRDLVPEGASTGEEADSEVARLKSSATLVAAVGTAVRLHEQPPAQALTIETPWTDVQLTAAEWAEAFESAEPGSTHNDARDQVWEELVQILVDKFDEEGVPPTVLRRWLAQSEELTRAFTRAWPLLDPAGVVADLLSVPAYLSACAPQLSAGERRILLRPHPREWTTADLPLLDAARQRIGDPEAPARRRRRDAVLAAEREERARVVEHLLESDDSEMQVLSILRGEDARNSLDDDAVLPAPDPDLL
ncbi:MAG TPA: RNA polymerase recycling motor ATPase HelR, partial [Naasia sp.]